MFIKKRLVDVRFKQPSHTVYTAVCNPELLFIIWSDSYQPHCLLFSLLQLNRSWMKLQLMLTQHFLLLQRCVESVDPFRDVLIKVNRLIKWDYITVTQTTWSRLLLRPQRHARQTFSYHTTKLPHSQQRGEERDSRVSVPPVLEDFNVQGIREKFGSNIICV